MAHCLHLSARFDSEHAHGVDSDVPVQMVQLFMDDQEVKAATRVHTPHDWDSAVCWKHRQVNTCVPYIAMRLH